MQNNGHNVFSIRLSHAFNNVVSQATFQRENRGCLF